MDKKTNIYQVTDSNIWSGRTSDNALYFHEIVQCADLSTSSRLPNTDGSIALLGYACEEGVRRNQGRIGAIQGPDSIRKQMAKLPHHLTPKVPLFDVGTLSCVTDNLEEVQESLAITVSSLLEQNTFPILLGGGHDIAYGHYKGIRNYLTKKEGKKRIGIINFDAHFDLRSPRQGANSGTPFYQIAQDCIAEGHVFKYLCLGIREDANTATLFQTAERFGVHYILNTAFKINYLEAIQKELLQFIDQVDHLYVTIDMDGFSSAYAPGVSAASPMGFSPDVVLEVLELLIDSKKIISLDIAELNPVYDRDHQTAKLAASLIHFIVHRL